MIRAAWSRYRLDFRFTAITSRERMNHKDTYYIKVWNSSNPDIYGLGEAALFKGLSIDDRPDYEARLATICRNPQHALEGSDLDAWPSIRTGLETALLDLQNGGRRTVFPSEWSAGHSSIKINGLVWMGSADEMTRRMREKIEAGFDCIKIKIGGIDFDRELQLLSLLRTVAPKAQLRLDANGAFAPDEALRKLEKLAMFGIHSIEQPIKAGQWREMAEICRYSPIPIALDEELIPLTDIDSRQRMLEAIHPSYIILKPTLTGGFSKSREWIDLASKYGAGWWITSALESDIGLNAIAQWTATLSPTLPQGLGTGQLYSNNIPSPLTLKEDHLYYNADKPWHIPQLKWF
ncbi:MAG: o-succinylbenzoate synthase [Muribaculaceae bacterium]|nr:o-succinylbenzoate synthase [Muribaculaceae bacterium]